MKYRVKDFDFKIEPLPSRVSRVTFEELGKWAQKQPMGRFATHEEMQYVKRLRLSLKTDHDYVKVTITHKSTGVSDTYELSANWRKSYHYLLERIQKLVRSRRIAKRICQPEVRSGLGTIYRTIGGVHTDKSSILEIWRTSPLNNITSTKVPLSQSNYIGIELEFNEGHVDPNRTDSAVIQNALAKYKRYVQLTRDQSCGHELRVLLPEEGFEEKLTGIMDTLKGLGFRCDHRCGGHVHFDMRNRDHKKVYKNLVRSLDVMKLLVAKGRLGNRFCQHNLTDEYDLAPRGENRYWMVNSASYDRHQTLEVRLHQGTLEASEMVTWIKFLLKIVNYSGEFAAPIKTGKNLYEYIEFSESEKETLRSRYNSVSAQVMERIFG